MKREIKVHDHVLPPEYGKAAKVKPKLILCGYWLKEAGIEAGSRVTVEVLPDRLIITS